MAVTAKVVIAPNGVRYLAMPDGTFRGIPSLEVDAALGLTGQQGTPVTEAQLAGKIGPVIEMPDVPSIFSGPAGPLTPVPKGTTGSVVIAPDGVRYLLMPDGTYRGIPDLQVDAALGLTGFHGTPITEAQLRGKIGPVIEMPNVPGALSSLADPTAIPVQPGLQHEQFLLQIGLEETIANLNNEIQRIQAEVLQASQALSERQTGIQEAQFAETQGLAEMQFESGARLQEAQLAANPADFVAFELYKRSLQEAGLDPTSPARSDVDIQNLFELVLGLPEERAALGTGRFGASIPTTGEISRERFGALSPTDIGVLSSFLEGGVETEPGVFQGINPADYFQEVQEGFIPTIGTGTTQVRF